MAADRISIQLGANTDALTQGLSDANDAVAASADQMNQIWAALTTQTTAQFAQANEAIASSFDGVGSKASATQAALAASNQAIASDFATLGQTMTSSWNSTQSAMTSASESGASARTTLEQSASTTLLANLAQTAIKGITNNALSSFAGVFANLAPLLGPDAAAPAASAQATVLAAASGIASAAGGWEVPEDTLAFVHKDEKILPAAYSQGLDKLVANANAGTGSSGGDVHFHINAIDTQSATSFINQNMTQIVSGLKRQARNFAIPASS